VTATEDANPDELERAVFGVMQTFFYAHRNERWMPTQIVQASCPGVRSRRVREALARLTASGRIERAPQRRGNPYTNAYRLVTRVGPRTIMEGT
jgi:hypothetical protein